MRLTDYFKRPGALSVAELSDAIGCKSPAQVRQWVAAENDADIRRLPGAAYCSSIQAATKNAVMRWDLRPDDWHRIWPELIDVQGSPPIKATA